ncbi:hypothetical protein DUNSADRAFT_18220 [Dunaliella salina]|uniref:Uncharacterized protein n=1 Tax=Dunaliella salina TaxID=3046 RepID=A0ABQ7GZC6_DUNSA|nr:hypothetical protein DUNSADRAFT_18220 [Dunaliella salina]|eukprot:KAF5839939.1 hypothetical protein DUNSADRAFT_18220 [Dunaliella salina]
MVLGVLVHDMPEQQANKTALFSWSTQGLWYMFKKLLGTSSTSSNSSSSTMNRAPAEGDVPVGKLPGTPAPGAFPIKENRLIEIAKEVFDKGVGVEDESMITPDFRFEFPVVSLPRDKYLEAVRNFKLKEAFPNMNTHAYDWRVDPYEQNRVWFTVRNTATHTGPLRFLTTYKPTGKVVQGAPECMSLVFNEDGKVKTYTGGYVMDRRVGNTQGLGGMFGILAAIGGPVLKPGSPVFFWLLFKNAVKQATSAVFNVMTFGIFRKKKTA